MENRHGVAGEDEEAAVTGVASEPDCGDKEWDVCQRRRTPPGRWWGRGPGGLDYTCPDDREDPRRTEADLRWITRAGWGEAGGGDWMDHTVTRRRRGFGRSIRPTVVRCACDDCCARGGWGRYAEYLERRDGVRRTFGVMADREEEKGAK